MGAQTPDPSPPGSGVETLEATLRRQQRFVDLLQRVAEAANAARSIDEAAATALRELCDATAWTTGHLVLVHGDQLQATALWHPPGVAGEAVGGDARGGPLAEEVVRHAEPVWVESLEREPGHCWHLADRVRARAAAAFPVFSGEQVVAVIEFLSPQPVARDDDVFEVMAHVGLQLGRVVERERTERELRTARRLAEEANRAKSDFLSRMSHELRTPLNAVLGFTELLEMEDLSPEAQDYAASIAKAGNHLLTLINDVLDIARIEAGKLSLSIEPVPARELLDECRTLVRPLASARGINLVDEPPADDVHLLADHQRVKQVLLNLVANAIKYNRENGSVVVQLREFGGDRIRLEVADTGYGIPAHQLERLFAPFERLEANRTTVEGTGLGLALSRQLTEAMGGTIGVRSTVDVGSVFWIEFPRAASVVGRARPERTTRVRRGTEDLPRRSVLYVEDTLSNIQLIERILERRPHVDLVTAMQGGLALDLAREHRPDLILLDVHLPDIQGDEVLRRLRQDPRTRDIAVIVVSADATQRQIDRLLEAGANGYLTKPLVVRQFLSVIDAYIGVPEPAAKL